MKKFEEETGVPVMEMHKKLIAYKMFKHNKTKTKTQKGSYTCPVCNATNIVKWEHKKPTLKNPQLTHLSETPTPKEVFQHLLQLEAHDSIPPVYGPQVIDVKAIREKLHEWFEMELSKPEEITAFPSCLNKLVRDHFLSDEALKKGYNLEDLYNFLHWIEYKGFNLDNEESDYEDEE